MITEKTVKRINKISIAWSSISRLLVYYLFIQVTTSHAQQKAIAECMGITGMPGPLPC